MKIAIIGYGKMGHTIEKLAKQMGHEVVCIRGRGKQEGKLEHADVAIEFSVPAAAYDNIRDCIDRAIPVVSGTTGWLDRYEQIVELCRERNGSFLYASNFSIGVNLFFELNRYAASLISGWDMYTPSMEEIHHIHKKDAPSGTAISLAKPVCEAFGLQGWTLEEGKKDQLHIHARREGEVKGTHSIQYTSQLDGITLKHEAFTREGFAKGAILAASWLRGKTGVFDMADVLGLDRAHHHKKTDI